MLFVRVTIFERLTTKQNVMKKAKYLYFERLEKVVLKSGNTDKQLFATNRKLSWIQMKTIFQYNHLYFKSSFSMVYTHIFLIYTCDIYELRTFKTAV